MPAATLPMRDDPYESQFVLPLDPWRTDRAAKTDQGDVAAFLYDLAIIVSGLAGAVILLRFLVEALSG